VQMALQGKALRARGVSQRIEIVSLPVECGARIRLVWEPDAAGPRCRGVKRGSVTGDVHGAGWCGRGRFGRRAARTVMGASAGGGATGCVGSSRGAGGECGIVWRAGNGLRSFNVGMRSPVCRTYAGQRATRCLTNPGCLGCETRALLPNEVGGGARSHCRRRRRRHAYGPYPTPRHRHKQSVRPQSRQHNEHRRPSVGDPGPKSRRAQQAKEAWSSWSRGTVQFRLAKPPAYAAQVVAPHLFLQLFHSLHAHPQDGQA
jgi:hypothetical protein